MGVLLTKAPLASVRLKRTAPCATCACRVFLSGWAQIAPWPGIVELSNLLLSRRALLCLLFPCPQSRDHSPGCKKWAESNGLQKNLRKQNATPRPLFAVPLAGENSPHSIASHSNFFWNRARRFITKTGTPKRTTIDWGCGVRLHPPA